MRHFGVVGFPIEHSVSPQLFKRYYPSNEFHYTALAAESAAKAYALFCEMGLEGINITAPLKPIRLWSEVVEINFDSSNLYSIAASKLGVMNTLKRSSNGLLYGYNTDIAGVEYALRGVKLSGARAVIIGAGGAALSAKYALSNLGVTDIILLNRTPKSGCLPLSESDIYTSQADVIINTIGEAVLTELKAGQFLVDAIYHNSPYSHYESASNYAGGLVWLEGQGVESYKIFVESK